MTNSIDTPLFNAFRAELREIHQFKKATSSLDDMVEKYGSDQLALAEETLTIAESLGWDSIDVFCQYIMDYLKEQIAFEKTGSYGDEDFDTIKQNIYDNPEVMKELYLPGLFMAYPLVTVMFRKFMFFESEFLPLLSEDMQGAEVGFGDGFYLWRLLNRYPNAQPKGYDISVPALEFCTDLLVAAGYPQDKYDLQIANVFEGLPLEDNSLDWGMLAEIIEHIPNPVEAIIEVGRKLKPGGLLYLTTVLDSNHMDHISNFESPEVVEGLITDSGYTITNKLIYSVRDDIPDSTDRGVNMAYIARKN